MKEYNIDLKEEFKKIDKLISNEQNFAVIGHNIPDGDAVGSGLALKYFLEYLGKNVQLVYKNISNKIKKTSSIEGIREDINFSDYVCIVVDTSNKERLDFLNILENSKKSILIDHHKNNKLYGDINIVDIMTSTTELIYLYIKNYFKEEYDSFKKSKETREIYLNIIHNIMLGIITDSGGFRHQNINALAFEIAKEAKEEGVDIFNIYRINIIEKSKAEFNLDRLVREKIEYYEDSKISSVILTKDDKEYMDIQTGEDDSICNIGKEREGNLVSILIKEDKEKKDNLKVSVRTNHPYSAYNIVKEIGGGGHEGAAGADINIKNIGNKEDEIYILKNRLIDLARIEMKNCFKSDI